MLRQNNFLEFEPFETKAWGILKCVQDRACSSLLASARTEIVVNSVTYPTIVGPHIWTSATANF